MAQSAHGRCLASSGCLASPVIYVKSGFGGRQTIKKEHFRCCNYLLGSTPGNRWL